MLYLLRVLGFEKDILWHGLGFGFTPLSTSLRCYCYCHSTREMIIMVMNGYELWVCMPLATYNVGFIRSKWIVLFPTLGDFYSL